MATGPQLFPHLRLVNRVETQSYSPKRGRGKPLSLPPRDRAVHGQRILAQLQKLRPVFLERQRERERLGLDVPDGINVEFRSFPGFELAFESLDIRRSGIELLNVTKRDGITYATCWIPDGKLDVLVRRVTAYLNEETKTLVPKPRNAMLVESIEEIGVATMLQLWTDEEAFPTGSSDIWWEVWLRDDLANPAATFRRFQAAALSQKIELPEQRLEFPERVVVIIKATRAKLAAATPLLNLVAELRHADRPPVVPHSLTIAAQDDIVTDLAARTDALGDLVSVAILDTGIARAHPLIAPMLNAADMHSVNDAWGTFDHNGHGTKMAGVVLYGDLRDTIVTPGRISIPFKLESAVLLPPKSQFKESDDRNMLGAITAQAVFKCEIQAPHNRRVICKAVTSHMHQAGKPSSYSAKIDALAFNADEVDSRLFVIAAGNVFPEKAWLSYPESNKSYGVEHPGQAWNVLTVGAYTEKDSLPGTAEYAGWRTLAPSGDLSPFSATSLPWKRWPVKPDVVFEGGNVAVDSSKQAHAIPDSTQLLTTARDFNVRPLTHFSMTSAATAQAAGLCGRIWATGPDLWPESVRGLVVHSATWTDAQRQAFPEKRDRLRALGHGVPDVLRALHSTRSRVSLIAQEEMQPYRLEDGDGKMNELCIFGLPWPKDTLLAMGATEVRLRVTLSYYIEPSPGERGWGNRYRYASHGLRFDLKRTNETDDVFLKRVNYAMREENEVVDTVSDPDWDLGWHLRNYGCVHSDQWRGTAAALATRQLIAVYPIVGWWRERLSRGRCTSNARFSLILTLECDDLTVDLYSQIENLLNLGSLETELG